MLTMFFGIVFFCLCFQAGLKDSVTLTIPNWMNAAFFILFIPAALAGGLAWQVVGMHVLVSAIALVLAFGLFAFNLFGGGDAKMIPGVLLWIGPEGVLHFIFGTALAGGLLSIFILLARNAVPADIAPGFARKILNEDNGIPYGVAIAAGAFFASPQSPLLIDLVNQLNGLS